MATRIQIRRDTTTNWSNANPVLSSGELGLNTTTGQFKIGDGTTAWNSLNYFVGYLAGGNLNDLNDVTITSAADGQYLRWDGSAWVNDAINLSTDTVGDYVASLVAGTAISITNNSGEASTPTITLNAAQDDLTDTVISSAEEFQSLTYNGTSWVNAYAPVVTYVRNAEATTLTTGTVVYLFGATGDHASVKRADNDSDTTSSKTIGLVAANIASAANGPIVTRGYVDGIDLSSGYTAGDILWLGEDGAFTTTKPSAPEHLVFIGVVVRATNNGIIYVATQNGYELDELHDVSIASKTSGDFLKYDGSLWVNDQINLGTDTVGNYVSDLTAGTGVTVTHTPGEGSSPTVAIGQAVGTSDNPSFAGATVGNIRIGISSNNIIDTTSGSITIHPLEATGSGTLSGENVTIEGAAASGTGTNNSGAVSIYGGYASGGTTNNGGIVQIDGGYGSDSAGYVNIGAAYASAVTIGHPGITTTIDSNAVITGNLTVSGTTTTVNTTTLNVADNLVTLNSDVTTGSPSENAGIEVLRGSSNTVSVRWNETNDAWELTNDGTSFGAIATEGYVQQLTDALDDIGDVSLTSAVSGDVLTYNGTSWINQQPMPAGSLTQFAGSSAPSGWLVCDGSAISRTTYAALFAVVSTTYGSGNGTTTFNIPNLKGKVPVGLDSSQTEFDALGETGGAKTHTLTTSEMPSHTHTQNAHSHTASTGSSGAHQHGYNEPYNTSGMGPAGSYGYYHYSRTALTDSAGSHTHTVTVDSATATNQSTGGGGAHNNLQPYIVLNYIIKT